MKIKKIICLVILSLAMLFPFGAAAKEDTPAAPPKPTVPTAALSMASEMDWQLAQLLGDGKQVTLIVTTPVNLNNLQESSPLGRQIAEEVSYQFVRFGYQVQEIRKGAGLVFDPKQGEFLLTRDPDMLESTAASSAAILVGTYTITPRNVRINMKLLHTPTQEVLAMSTATIPLTREVRAMTSDLAMERWGRLPSVSSRLTSENTAGSSSREADISGTLRYLVTGKD